ncbi:MAG: glutamate--cysteine ligase [Verrucomicrobiales bacterium]|nr:glutamate--cysteine ligase [Verrucomicrobiales bacterium]
MPPRRLSLFAAHGVEIEYMIVGAERLDVLPVADELIKSVAGAYVSDVERDGLDWSNELVAHVIELKTHGPAADLAPLPAAFQAEVGAINRILAGMHARLMPTAMHPWMDPFTETRLWPHDYSPIYQAYDRIFDCRGHGWSNLQSVHLNLPFANEAEFGRLHAGIRLVLPLLPGLAASSPFQDGRATGRLDSRLENYRVNSAKIPSITAAVVPEPIYTEAAYREQVFARMYRDIAPLDPEGILQDEFLNARGAIARFDRGSIEIRLLDTQECPAADLAIVALVSAVLRALAAERWTPLAAQQACPTEPLAALLIDAIHRGEQAPIPEPDYRALFGLTAKSAANVGDLWRHLADELWPAGSPEAGQWRPILDVILEHGPLARRILKATGPAPARDALEGVYRQLCDCLAEGRLFDPRN